MITKQFASFVLLLGVLVKVTFCDRPGQSELIEGQVNETLSSGIVSNQILIFHYDFYKEETKFGEIYDDEVTIHLDTGVGSLNDTGACPVMVAVEHNKDQFVVRLPIIYQFTNKSGSFPEIYQIAGRRLCLQEDRSLPRNQTVVRDVWVTVTTCSLDPLPFNLRLEYNPDQTVKINDTIKFSVCPTSSKLLKFYFPHEFSSNDELVLIDVSSNANVSYCTTFSVQKLNCPVVVTKRHSGVGYTQTITSSGSMIIPRQQFPDGFFLIFVVHPTNDACEMGWSPGDIIHDNVFLQDEEFCPRENNFTVTLKPVSRQGNYSAPMWGSVLIPLTIIVTLEAFIFLWMVLTRKKIINLGLNVRGFLEAACSAVRQTTKDGFSRNFWRLTLIVGVFHAVPAIQLVINWIRILNATGEHDLCYFNAKCALPNLFMGVYFTDFNHIWSNLLYILLGILFLVKLTFNEWAARAGFILPETQPNPELIEDQRLLQDNLESGDEQVNQQGDEQDNINDAVGETKFGGTFAALGLSLILEGVMSAAYHVCPSDENFQFDTNFMFAICGIVLSLLYRFRTSGRPNIEKGGKISFTVFLALAAISLLQVFIPTFQIRMKIVVSVIHSTIFISVALCRSICKAPNESLNRVDLNPKLIYVEELMNILVQSAVLAAAWILDLWVSTYILYIFISNVLVYLNAPIISYFWQIDNQRRSEDLCRVCRPLVYLILGVVFMSVGMYFFAYPESSWNLSPAYSRQLNADCDFLDFYDKHDMWHFCSAIGLYCLLMTLLEMRDTGILEN